MSAITSQPRPNEMYSIVPTNEEVNIDDTEASLRQVKEDVKNKKKEEENTEDIESVIETCCCPDPCCFLDFSNSCFESIANCIHTCCEDSSNDNIVDGSGGNDNCDVDCGDCFCNSCDD